MSLSEKIEIDELLVKLLRGNLHPDEKEELRKYIQHSYKDHSVDQLMHQHWQKLEVSETENDHSLDHLKVKLWELVQDDISLDKGEKKVVYPDWKQYVVRAAAVLLIPLLAYTAFLYTKQNKQAKPTEMVMQRVVANPGTRSHFFLPDSSEVWLNSKSSLEFPANFNSKKERNVKLTGQGYFKVKHNRKKPFLVDANNILVKVLGTSFDVSNYSDDGNIVSTLEEGSIAILDKQKNEVAKLVPGQQATLNLALNKLFVEEVETVFTTSWKDGRLIFRDAPLADVVKKMERWFNCEIEVDKSLAESDIRYSATIQNETLGEVLQMIEISTSAKTNIEKRKVRIWTE